LSFIEFVSDKWPNDEKTLIKLASYSALDIVSIGWTPGHGFDFTNINVIAKNI